jgi:hypothetical protein
MSKVLYVWTSPHRRQHDLRLGPDDALFSMRRTTPPSSSPARSADERNCICPLPNKSPCTSSPKQMIVDDRQWRMRLEPHQGQFQVFCSPSTMCR